MVVPMTSTKILAEKLAAHPELEKRVSDLINIVDAEPGRLDKADEAEEAVIENLRELGKELLTEWGTGKESQTFNEAHGSHPESSVKKKDLLGNNLWGCSP